MSLLDFDLTVETWPIERLIEYGRNPRKNDSEVDRMCAVMREFGFRIPIVAKSDGLVVDGHLRLKAARKLGLKRVPVALADGLSEAQIKAFRLLANRSANWAQWDNDLLKIELEDLRTLDFDLTLTGFDTKELAGFLVDSTTEGNTDPDEAPEAPSEPVTRPGDVWVLGAHRLMCGDCTRADHVATLLGAVKPSLMVTDPPYGVEYDPTARRALQSAGSKAATGKVTNDDRADWQDAWALFPGAVAYVWHGERQLVGTAQELQRAGFALRNLIVWGKSKLVVGRGNYHSQHETCWYAVRKGATGQWEGDRKQTTLWQIDTPKKSETGHATQKPVECMARPIRNNSSPGQGVYDPFVGSGTTIVAGEMTGRPVFAMEVSPAYVDVAATRWAAFTGKVPVLEATGQTWAEVMAERQMGAVPVAKVAKAKPKRKAVSE